MSPDLEQLFRDSHAATPPSRVDLDAVVRRGRRVRVRHQVRGAATIGVTGAVVLGIGAVAVSGTGRLGGAPLLGTGSGGGVPAGCQLTSTAEAAVASPAPTADPKGASAVVGSEVGSPPPANASPSSTSGPGSPPTITPSGSAGSSIAASSAPASGSPASTDGSATSPSPGNATSEAVPGPGSGTTVAVKPDGPPPAALTAVRLPDPAPGFGARRAPDSVGLEAGSSDGQTHWTAVFLVGQPCAHEATVIVGTMPMPATSGTPTFGATPGPITERPTVDGRPAYVTHDGDQTILYFATSRFTVEVVGSRSTTIAELVTLAEALENIG